MWSDSKVGALARELYRRCGLVFEGGQAHLFQKRVGRRAEEAGFGDSSSYAKAILSGNREEEFERLIELLTVNETYFFREEEHFQILLDHFWPQWLKDAKGGPIRVWSAACSTGCEPYTLGMLLREKSGAYALPGAVQILGSDVNARVLETAQNALFGDFSLRNTPNYYREKYFHKEKNGFRLSPQIADMVRFRQLNLLRCDVDGPREKFHAIFCRNVLIYFDLNAKRRVIGALARSLVPGGVLLVGRSESLFNVPEAPPVVNMRGVLVHRKT